MVKENEVTVVKTDYSTPEKRKEMDELDRKREEEWERQRKEEAERRRLQEEAASKQRVEDWKILHRKPKPKEMPYKPSRLLNVDSDLAIQNMEEDLKSVKETVEHTEKVVGEIAEFLYTHQGVTPRGAYRNDRKPPAGGKKSERFKMKQLSRNGTLRGAKRKQKR